MKRTLLNAGFVVICIIIFVAAISISFQVGMAVIMGKAYVAWETDWSDQVGTIYRDIDLNEADGTGYDLYIPADADKEKDQTLIVYIHGGGFTSGDKSDGERLCKYFTSKGYICASVNYTLKDGVHESNFNKMYEQILEQVGSMKEKAAELGYRITEMATSGDSAGGYLALLYAYRGAEVSPIPVKLVFQMTGPATFEPEVWGETSEENMLLSASEGSGKVVTHDMIASGEFDAIIKEISPSLLVSEQTVPTVMAYGPKDKVVPVQLKYALIDALEKYGVDYTYIEFPNSGHGMLFDPDKTQEYVDTVNSYLEKYMDNH